MKISMKSVCMFGALATLGCGDKGGGDGADGSGDAGDESSDTTDGTTGDTGDSEGMVTERAVDILFVIDNSGSMGEEQRRLVDGLEELISLLEQGQVDYRIGFTTTDDGNPWCTGTTPESGALRATSCRSRLEDFVFEGTTPPLDRQAEACIDVCNADEIELTPTPTAVDPTPSERAWVERIDGVSNVAGGLDPASALGCLAPQGINGCGFESHLGSMLAALEGMEDPQSPNYGFRQPGSLLTIVFVTDEADCTDADENIFLAEGGQVFWSDELSQFPTSAVCWNAGVRCSSAGPDYGECSSENYDDAGNAGATDADAVLQPLSDFLGAVDQATTYIAAINGVPQGYAAGDAELTYKAGVDLQYQTDFGIGPSCQLTDGLGKTVTSAIPPVRVRELIEGVSGPERNLFSVCAPEFGPALETIAARILLRLE